MNDVGHYSDGHPLDDVQYLECKLILKPAKDVHVKARQRCEQFFITLQYAARDWISIGTTKTGMVYRLQGNVPQHHE
jgi:hypothetical protein